jgi:hypothetical protein
MKKGIKILYPAELQRDSNDYRISKNEKRFFLINFISDVTIL